MRRTSNRTRRSTSGGGIGSGPSVPSATAPSTSNVATADEASFERSTGSTRSSAATEATVRGGRRRTPDRSNENRTSPSGIRAGQAGKATKKRAAKKRGSAEVEGEGTEAEGEDATVTGHQSQPRVVLREEIIPSVTGRVLAALQLLAADTERCSNAFLAISRGRFSGIILQLTSSEEETSSKTKGRGRGGGKPMAKSRKPSKKKSASRSSAGNDEPLNATAEVDANLIAVSTFTINGIIGALLEKHKQCKGNNCDEHFPADQEKTSSEAMENVDVEKQPRVNAKSPLYDDENAPMSADDKPGEKTAPRDEAEENDAEGKGGFEESPTEDIGTNTNHTAEVVHLAITLAAFCRQLSAVILFDATGEAVERCFNGSRSTASAENAVTLGDIPPYFIPQSAGAERSLQPQADMKQNPSSIVGRAIVSVTIGSVLAMESLAKATADAGVRDFIEGTAAASREFDADEDFFGKVHHLLTEAKGTAPIRLFLRSAMWSSLNALEMLVRFAAKRPEFVGSSQRFASSVVDTDTSRLHGLVESGGAARDKKTVEADASSSSTGINITATAPEGTTSNGNNALSSSCTNSMGTSTGGSAPQHLHFAPNPDIDSAWSTVFARYLETDAELCFEQRTQSFAALDGSDAILSEVATDSPRFQLLLFACQYLDRMAFAEATDDRTILSKALEMLLHVHTSTSAGRADETVEIMPPSKRVRWDDSANESGTAEEVASSTRSGIRRRSARSSGRAVPGETKRAAQKTVSTRAQEGVTFPAPAALPSDRMRLEQFVRFDESIPARRLASVSLTWLCEGHKRLLETAVGLLRQNDDTNGHKAGDEVVAGRSVWVDIMEMPTGSSETFGVSGGNEKKEVQAHLSPSPKKSGGSPPSRKRSRARRTKSSSSPADAKREESDAASSRKEIVVVPGNTAQVAFVACIIDVLSESVSIGGIRAPGGGISLYVGGVVLRLDAFQNWREVVIEATAARPTSLSEAVASGVNETAASVAESLSSQLGAARTSSRTRSSRNSRRTPATRAPKTTEQPPAESATTTDGSNDVSNSQHPAQIPDPPTHDWKRPDIRTHAAVLMRLIVISHRRCLNENLSSILSAEKADSNDEIASCVHADRSPHVARIEEIVKGTGNDLLINGDVLDSSLLSTALVSQFYPFVHSALQTLAKAAASSSIEIARSIDPTPASERLIALASAFSLGDAMYRDHPSPGVSIVTDARLCSMAVNQLVECLSGAISDVRTTSSGGNASVSAEANGGMSNSEDGDQVMDDGEDNYSEEGDQRKLMETLITRHRLDEPLIPVIGKELLSPSSDETYGGCFPLPSDVATAAVQDDASLFVAFQTGMGLLSGRRRARPDEILSIFLRAIISSRDGSSTSSPGMLAKAMQDLISRLLRIVSSCYASRRFELRASSSDVDNEVGHAVDSAARESFISVHRAVLASDVLTALRRCLAHVRSNHAAVRQSQVRTPNLRSLIRQIGLSKEHVVFVVELGHLFDRIVLRPRTHYDLPQHSQDGRNHAFLSVAQSPPDFTPWERRLWLSHIKFCVAVGRGKTSFDSSHFSNSEEKCQQGQGRYEVLVRVASWPLRESGEARSSKALWPLFLSPVQQALVSANLASEPIPINEEAARPEILICDGMIASVSKVIHELKKQPLDISEDCLRKIMWDPWLPTSGSVLLSLHDCRLLTLAVCRLPDDLRAKKLSSVLDLVKLIFPSDEGLPWKESLITQHSEVSSFVARLLTVVATLVDIVSVKSDLLGLLCLQVRPTHYHLPSWLPANPDSSGSPYEQDSMSWYRRDRCFMGLFSDWESPSLPATTVVGFSDALEIPVMEEFCSSLQVAFEVGFRTSKCDRCHLLFAAWNALAKSSGWFNKDFSSVSCSSSKSTRISDQVLHIRASMFELFQYVHDKERNIRESLLTRVLQLREQAQGGSSVKGNSLPNCNSKVSEALAARAKKHAESPAHISLDEFVLMECTAIFASFIVALHTRSDFALFPECDDTDKQRTGVRKKKTNLSSTGDVVVDEGDDTVQSDDSGDSDIVYAAFEDDDMEEAKIDALARLHDSCNALGCAPVHPDYLDTSCKLSPDISVEDAIRSAHDVLASLTKLALTAWKMMTQRQIEGLASASVAGEEGTRLGQPEFAVQLQWSGLQDPTVYSDDDEDDPETEQSFRSTVAALCNIDDSSIDLFDLGRPAGYQMHGGKRLWCPHASHVISGKLREVGASLEGWKASASELRATNEWEVLLSECIQATCLCIVTVQNGSERESSFADRHELFLQAKCWRRILETCVTSLVPAAALLRLGLADGKGSPPHPLHKNVASSDDEQVLTTTALGDEVFAKGQNSSSLGSSVTHALSFLSFLSSNKEISDSTRQNCRACMGHLVNGSGQVEALERLWSTLLGASSITGVCHVLEAQTADIPAAMGEAVDYVLNHLLQVVDEQSGTKTTESEGIEAEGDSMDADVSADTRKSLLGSLGCRGILTFNTVADSELDATEAVASFLEHMGTLSTKLKASCTLDALAKSLIILLNRRDVIGLEARVKVAFLVRRLIETEQDQSQWVVSGERPSPLFLRGVIGALDGIEKPAVERLVDDDLCMSLKSDDMPERKEVLRCQMVGILFLCVGAGCSSKDHQGKGLEMILGVLLARLGKWAPGSDDLVMDLTFALSSRFKQITSVGVGLMEAARKEHEKAEAPLHMSSVDSLEQYFRFIRDLRLGLDKSRFLVGADTQSVEPPRVLAEMKVNPDPIQKPSASLYYLKEGSRILRTCSFVKTGGDFVEQHWYVCYTCGLSHDKGCCSLCALTCHKGHDVGYSRKSSFFCDCGAESPKALENNRVPCKCLHPLSDDDMAQVFDAEPSHSEEPFRACDDDAPSELEIMRNNAIEHLAADKPQADDLWLEFASQAKNSNWVSDILHWLVRSLQSWSQNFSKRNHAALLECFERNSRSVQPSGAPRTNDLSLESRKGRGLVLSVADVDSMLLSRLTKSAVVNVRLSVDSSSDRMKKAIMTKHDIRRQALVADARGRMIIAEPGALLFCSALPLVNLRHVNKPLESPLDRSQLCILGSAKVNFSIVGMQLCPQNDRHLVIWGTSEVSVVVLSSSCDRIVRRIELSIDLEPGECESEYVIKCEWMPSSEAVVAVVCGAFVKFFNTRRSTWKSGVDTDLSCRSMTCYTVAYEDAVIRSSAFVEFGEETSPRAGVKADDGSYGMKLALLFDSGRLHMVELVIDANGDLEDQGETYIEVGEGIQFPIAGVRRYGGSSPEGDGSVATSFGEGSSLHFLRRSRLLLYKCVSSCTLALMIGSNGQIVGSFEFLPHMLSPSTLGSDNDGYSISAPFTHWTELGLVRRKESSWYRVAVVGKSMRTNQGKMLCLEFNKNKAHVKELGPPSSLNSGFNTAVEGMACFSAPYLQGEKAGMGMVGKGGYFVERLFMVALTSSGAVQFYAEEIDTDSYNAEAAKTAMDGGCRDNGARELRHTDSVEDESDRTRKIDKHAKALPSFPLTIFETLRNVSGTSELEFGGDAASSEPDTVKRKLAITNGDFLISPSREGCTLTCVLKSLQPQGQTTVGTQRRSDTVPTNEKVSTIKNSHDDKQKAMQECQDEYAITAVRLLVGATATEYLPRRVTVMGRPVTMIEGAKRWYDIPLSDEEIMIGIRNGFVSITIGPSFDSSNNSIIDGAEVYATKRSSVHFLRNQREPTTLQIQPTRCDGNDYFGTNEFRVRRNQLCLCLRFAINIGRTLGSEIDMSTIDEITLESLIQLTMFDHSLDLDIRGLVVEMIDSLNGSVAEKRQHFIKKSLMKGIIYTLNGMSVMALGNASETTEIPIWLGLRRYRRNCPVGKGRYSIELMDKCLDCAADVLRSHPLIYSQALAALLPQIGGLSYLSVYCKSVLDAITKERTADISETASRIAHLALLELSRLRLSSYESSTIMDTLQILLRSQDVQVVTRCCQALSEGLRDRGRNGGMHYSPKSTAEHATSVPGVAYQCDGCQALPITDLRYTLEGNNVDLCEQCWQKCRTYARGREGSEPVVVDGKRLKVGDSEVMTCAQIQEMRQLKVVNTIVKQVEEVLRVSDNPSSLSSTMDTKMETTIPEQDDAAALKVALRMSLESETELPKGGTMGESRDSALSHVSDMIFSNVLSLGVGALTTGAQDQVVHRLPVLQLLLSLVTDAENEETELERGRLVCQRTCEEIRRLVDFVSLGEKSRLTASNRSSFVLLFRLLRSLIGRQEQSLASASSGSPDSLGVMKEWKTPSLTFNDTASVCKTHEIPVKRRRCRDGVHKGRHFSICGMERRHRCDHFRWESAEVDSSQRRTDLGVVSAALSLPESGSAAKKTKTGKRPGSALQSELWKLFSAGSNPLEAQLCALLDSCVQDSELRQATVNRIDDGIQDEVQASPSCLLESLRTEECEEVEKRDGVDKARDKLRGADTSANQGRAQGSSSDHSAMCVPCQSKCRDIDVVQSCLELISQFASTALLGFSPKEISSTWSSCWFALLCEMIGTSKNSVIRYQAKTILKRLCGGRRSLYHQVRDHYVFSLHFENLLANCEGPMEAALDVREMARRCGPSWRQEALSWSTLSAGSLLGVEDLIPEDSLTLSCQKKIDQVVDALLHTTKSRGDNWRQFCATAELPQQGSRTNMRCPASPEVKLESSAHLGSNSKEVASGRVAMSRRPPIFCLFWIGCVLHGPTQVKVFRLIDAAMSSSVTKEPRPKEKQVSFVTRDESCDGVSSEGGSDPESAVIKCIEQDHPRTLTPGSPEDTLLQSGGGLRLCDVYAFVMHFVLRGRVQEVRSAASKVAQSLLLALSSNDLNAIFVRFIAVLSGSEVSTLGNAAVEYLQFMNNFVSDHSSSLSPSLPFTAQAVVEWATQQLKALDEGIFSGIGDDATVVEVQHDARPPTKKRIDLSSCSHCCQNIINGDDGSDSGLGRNSSARNGTAGVVNDDVRVEERKRLGREGDDSQSQLNCFPWLAERMRQQTKLRLDASADNCVSTEFASHFQLKGRQAVFDVTLSVSDPRGRLLKTVGIYFTPRQVDDIQELKTSQYKPLWQRCGTLSLSRGSTQASFRFATPICAANLKFEYLEFFERGGASRATGGVGSMVLHCPRCTRVVNNAHGVCGHCGEVAFQCRRCRHINYDRLDAFLCVECGYCASGEFCFELMTSVVCNAPSIVDDDGYERAVKQLRTANRQHGESRNSLRKKLIAQASNRRKRSRGGDVEDLDDLGKYGSQMKRAMLGELPKGLGRSGGEVSSSHFTDSASRRSSAGSFVSSGAHRQEQSVRSVSSRGRSLLSLERQLRGDAGAVDSDRPSGREAPVRQTLVSGSSSGASAASSMDGFEDAHMDIQRIIGEGSSSTDSAIGTILSSIDVGDPLSRLVASIQARARGNSSRGSGRTSDAESSSVLGSLARDGQNKSSREEAVGSIFGGLRSEDGGDSSANSSGSASSALIALKEIEKQHREMREAEKEALELTRTINAWKRLNCDTLADYGGFDAVASENGRFIPSYCSVCAGGVALNLLLLVWSFLAVGSGEGENAFGVSFVQVLFDCSENAHATMEELERLKRLVIVTLATRSTAGSKLVLEELKCRLLGRTLRDTAAAEILGIVVGQEFDGVDEYVALATEVLEKCL